MADIKLPFDSGFHNVYKLEKCGNRTSQFKSINQAFDFLDTNSIKWKDYYQPTIIKFIKAKDIHLTSLHSKFNRTCYKAHIQKFISNYCTIYLNCIKDVIVKLVGALINAIKHNFSELKEDWNACGNKAAVSATSHSEPTGLVKSENGMLAIPDFMQQQSLTSPLSSLQLSSLKFVMWQKDDFLNQLNCHFFIFSHFLKADTASKLKSE